MVEVFEVTLFEKLNKNFTVSLKEKNSNWKNPVDIINFAIIKAVSTLRIWDMLQDWDSQIFLIFH